MKNKRLFFRINEELASDIKKVREQRSINISALARKLIKQYIQKELKRESVMYVRRKSDRQCLFFIVAR